MSSNSNNNDDSSIRISNSNMSSRTQRYTKDKLYELIPAIYRQHDATLGKPLEALIEIIAEQVEYLENDIDILYDNWFIETCQEWVVPYIGDLAGAKLLRSVEGAGISNRAWVANTLRYRRSKGTASVIEQIAKDVTNWDARAVEFFKLLITTQNINHIRLDNLSTLDIRNIERLELLGTPFDTIAHTIDVRNIQSQNQKGYYNIPNLGIFLWRIKSYPVINAPAFPHGRGRYSFSQLGLDMQLFSNPALEGGDDSGASNVNDKDKKHIAQEIDVSSPIRRLALSKGLKDHYYGRGKSILITTKSNGGNDSEITEVDQKMITVCNLSDWNSNNGPVDAIALDPVLGRIVFPEHQEPDEVYVNYYYGFSGDLGGGFYDREGGKLSDLILEQLHLDMPENLLEEAEKNIINISKEKPFSQALQAWEAAGRKSTTFKIVDSSTFYTESIAFTEERRTIPENTTLVIRSEDRERAVLKAPVNSPDSDLPMKITGRSGSILVLEGLVFDKSVNIRIKSGDLNYLCISHCTLVPGEKISLQLEVEDNNSDNSDSHEINDIGNGNDIDNSDGDVNGNNGGCNNNLTVVIHRSICGKISITNPGTRLMIIDSIIDGKQLPHNNGSGNSNISISSRSSSSGNSGSDDGNDYSENTSIECNEAIIERSTIFGKVKANLIDLASNSIFTDAVTALRTQEGCIRYSFIPIGSITPGRYRCQPTSHLVEIKPVFTSTRYGDPGYAQLRKDSPPEIFEGADNEAEMGVFNNLYQPQRIKNLESSLDEYLRFGLEAGISLFDANEAAGGRK